MSADRPNSMVSSRPMSIDTTAASPAHLTPTSYLVLGLIEREGPSTPYELKRHVAATIGHFWSFPHALLYRQPAHLVELGLLTEEREADGRRRRLFTITGRGRAAIRAWLATPSQEPTELRDAGLLRLFFADLGSADDRRALAVTQLAVHRAALTRYGDDRRGERGLNGSDSAARTVEHWRGSLCRWASSMSGQLWSSGRASPLAPASMTLPRTDSGRRTTAPALPRTRPGKTWAAKSRRAGEFRLPRLSGREPGCRHLRVSA